MHTIQHTRLFSYHHTRRGDFLIAGLGRDAIGRAATEAEAQRMCVAAQAEHDKHWANMQEEAANQEAFNRSTPELTTLQLEWQRWRNEYYSALMYEDKRVAASRRALDRIPAERAAHSPTYPGHERRCSEQESEISEAHAVYRRAVQLDTAIKNARREKNIQQLEIALHEAIAYAQHAQQIGMIHAEPPQVGAHV